MTEVDSSWVNPGAHVAVYVNPLFGERTVSFATVDRVAEKSFTLVGDSRRFQLSTLEHRPAGRDYISRTARVIERTDPLVDEVRRERALSRQRKAAAQACEEYIQWRTTATRRAAIARLQAVEEDVL
jgi:hypothetical protein